MCGQKKKWMILGRRCPNISAYYNITAEGNWEHGNSILLRNETDEAVAEIYKITVDELKSKIDAAKAKLLQVRKRQD